ncbi:hypothetical protein [Glaciibacter superstes]|uniref:hypothetical protein n=1 Tax=Glaciibacter superstes TaxID=501023 RepID=UPI0003B66228|nr:hypothetical protein [Glaciibacter superstes]
MASPRQSQRAAARTARRIELSGAGPAGAEHRPGRWPGASAKFALFGEVLYTGVLVSVLSVPLVTIPLAAAVGTRHLRRHLRGEESGIGLVGRDLKRGILGSLVIGFIMVAIIAALLVDLALATDGIIPGAALVGVVGWVGLVLVAVALLTAARLWAPETGWLPAIRSCVDVWRQDVAGLGYLLAAVLVVAVFSWQLLPLIVPGIGCLILALLAIPERRRTDDEE